MRKKGWRMPLVAVGGAVVIFGLAGTGSAGETPAAKAPAAATPAAQAVEKDWTDDLKQPTKWFRWGADERIRQEYIHNPFFFDTDPPGAEWNFNRIRTRVWGAITPCDNFEVYLRLTNEMRYWYTPDSRPTQNANTTGDWDFSDVVFDNLNFKVKNLFDSKSTLTVGRQDIILGDGWLVLEGTPGDGSRTIFFDAARLNIDIASAKTAVDLIYIQQYADPDKWLSPINSADAPMPMEQDERGAILYVTNKSLDNTQIDGYFIYKQDTPVAANGDQSDIYTVGSRIVHKFNQNWTGRVEGAYQFGNRTNPALFGAEDSDLSAWGMNSRLTYAFNDDWKNQLWIGLEMLSGDDPDDGDNNQFDPLWGRWPQFSELYVYPYATETRIAETTNLFRPNVGWTASPTKKMDLIATYQPLWAFENTRNDQGAIGFSSDNFRGHLVTAMLKYRFNRHVASHLLGEYLFAGDFYAAEGPRNDDNVAYLRWELVLTL